MSYIGIPPFGQTIRSITSTTATSGQTTFNITGGYVVGYVDVFLNGILLTPSDYTATDGLSVVLASGATTGDEFQALAYQPVSLVDTYRKSEVDSLINNIDALPTQTGQSGKYLTTDGTDASWGTVDLTSKVSKTGDTMTGALVTPMVVTDSSMNFRNRIINGDMRIDQRNAGASVTPSTDSTYTLDRWVIRNAGGAGRFSVVQSATSAANFPISVLLTNTTTAVPSSNEFYSLEQIIEGYNISDFGWGTANAKDITISFQVRSSLTGTYCVAVRNSTAERSFVSEFTITSANTFETKTLTIPGETSGTWNTTNNAALLLDFCLGVASGREGTAGSWQTTNIVGTSNQVDWINTSGATFYLTGVQLEVGSVASPFERRPYGTELALCQRYFQVIKATAGGASKTASGPAVGYLTQSLPVEMRTAPSIGMDTSGGNATALYYFTQGSSDHTVSSGSNLSVSTNYSTTSTVMFLISSSVIGWSVNLPLMMRSGNIYASSEL